jgi:hypothetical protein
VVLARVKEALKDLKTVDKVLLNEQSDKEYLIITIGFSAPLGEDWRGMKSDILRGVAAVHRSLRAEAKAERKNTGEVGNPMK